MRLGNSITSIVCRPQLLIFYMPAVGRGSQEMICASTIAWRDFVPIISSKIGHKLFTCVRSTPPKPSDSRWHFGGHSALLDRQFHAGANRSDLTDVALGGAPNDRGSEDVLQARVSMAKCSPLAARDSVGRSGRAKYQLKIACAASWSLRSIASRGWWPS